MSWDEEPGIFAGKTISDLVNQPAKSRKTFSFTLEVGGEWQFQNTPDQDHIEIWHYGHSKLRIKSSEVEMFTTALLRAKAQQDLLRATKGVS
jgi:hypothetical protein